jgi:hypothetical protein
MKSRSNDPLTRILNGWMESHAADAAHLDRLRHQVRQGIESPGNILFPVPMRRLSSPRRTWVAVAAALLVTFGYTTWRTVRHIDVATMEPEVQSLAGFGPNALSAKETLFASFDELFPGQFRWVVEVPNDTSLGLAPTASGTRSDDDAIVIRLVILTRGGEAMAWQPAWSCDVTARTQELIEIPSTASNPTHLGLWAYHLPDGNIAIDTDFGWDGPVQIQSASSEVQSPLVPTELMRLQKGQTEYRLLQTAAVVARHAG